jgi:hypothetical protein
MRDAFAGGVEKPKAMLEVIVSYKLDIFRKLPDGHFLWVNAVEGLEEAKSQLRRLAKLNPGDYMIYDTRLGCAVQSTVMTPS